MEKNSKFVDALCASCLVRFCDLLPAFWKVISRCNDTKGHIFKAHVIGLTVYIATIFNVDYDVLLDDLIVVLKNVKNEFDISVIETIDEKINDITKEYQCLCELIETPSQNND